MKGLSSLTRNGVSKLQKELIPTSGILLVYDGIKEGVGDGCVGSSTRAVAACRCLSLAAAISPNTVPDTQTPRESIQSTAKAERIIKPK